MVLLSGPVTGTGTSLSPAKSRGCTKSTRLSRKTHVSQEHNGIPHMSQTPETDICHLLMPKEVQGVGGTGEGGGRAGRSKDYYPHFMVEETETRNVKGPSRDSREKSWNWNFSLSFSLPFPSGPSFTLLFPLLSSPLSLSLTCTRVHTHACIHIHAHSLTSFLGLPQVASLSFLLPLSPSHPALALCFLAALLHPSQPLPCSLSLPLSLSFIFQSLSAFCISRCSVDIMLPRLFLPPCKLLLREGPGSLCFSLSPLPVSVRAPSAWHRGPAPNSTAEAQAGSGLHGKHITCSLSGPGPSLDVSVPWCQSLPSTSLAKPLIPYTCIQQWPSVSMKTLSILLFYLIFKTAW